MRVVHVAPTSFGAEGVLGGGERYPLELARALVRTGEVDCELVTFAASARRWTDGAGRCLTAYDEVVSSSGPRSPRRRPVIPTPAP